jgi:hypothetical protein
MHRFTVVQRPTGAGVKSAGRAMAFVGPQLHALIPCVARKRHALGQQLTPNALAPRLGHQQEQSQLGSGGIETHTKDGANRVETRAKSQCS